MKILFQILLLLLVISCKDHRSSPEIYGSWQTVINSKHSHSITDSVVFQKPDFLKIYYKQNGEVSESLFVKFSIDKAKKQLTTEKDGSKFHFEIIELTSSLLKTKQQDNNSIVTYRRLSN